MWLIVEYQPVTLFSFRSGVATSSGAKTLFLPTPFAIRMALLDATIRTEGSVAGPVAFEWIKELSIAVRPPRRVVVTNLFAKILKPTRKKESEKAMDQTLAFREYVHLEGTVSLAFNVSEDYADELGSLLTQINYFGKRGSFFQLIPQMKKVMELPADFVSLNGAYIEGMKVNGEWPRAFKLGLIQMMDDWGESLTFDKANIYTDKKIVVGKDRVRKGIVLPYQLVRSSKSFSYYERI